MYLLISVLVLLFCLLTLNRLTGILDLRRPNVVSIIFYLYFFLQFFIASLLVVYKLDDHYLINKITNDSSRIYGWYAINLTFILFPLGVWFSNIAFLRNHSSISAYHSYLARPVFSPLGRTSDKNIKLFLALFFMLALVLLIVVFKNLGFVGITQLIFGSEADFSVMRNEASRGYGGNVFLRNQLFSNILPIATCVAYSLHLRNKSLYSRLIFVGFLCLSIIGLTYNFAKAPILYLLISLVFVNLYHRRYVPLKLSLYFGGFIILLLIVQYALLSGIDIEVGYNAGPLGRLLISQSAGLFLAFDFFPTQHEFIGFASVSSFVQYIGIEPVPRAARLILENYNTAAVARGAGGVMNSLFTQEAYANFGWAGVVVAPIWVGFVCQSMQNIFMKLPKNDFMVGLQGKLIIGGAIVGGFNDYFYRPSLVILILICLCVYAFYTLLPKNRRKGSTL